MLVAGMGLPIARMGPGLAACLRDHGASLTGKLSIELLLKGSECGKCGLA
jgi:hypothetical protein